MKPNTPLNPKTLGEGEVLTSNDAPHQGSRGLGTWGWGAGIVIGRVVVMTAMSFLTIWWAFVSPPVSPWILTGVLMGLAVFWLLLNRTTTTARARHLRGLQHALLADDHQGFMAGLALDRKTVIVDGSNIYHFGHDNGFGVRPLRLLASQLRDEGYRVVCFFDANIHYTLRKHKAVPRRVKHSIIELSELFGLRHDEIFVVRSGVQADTYILECLTYLPVSFALTNDRYRDYENRFPSVMRSTHWRKGVITVGNELKLRDYSFKSPVYLT